MSWMQKLYRTYNEVEKSADLSDSDKETLAPLWHSPQTAHIKIVLSGDGDFISAEVLPDKTIVMLPVTEDSEGRTSGLAPHALADSLQYIAKDLALTYTAETVREVEGSNGRKKIIKEKKEELIFKLYSDQLDRWCACTDNPKILAIQKYIHKGTVLKDLIKAKVVPTDNNGKLLESWSRKDSETQEKPKLLDVLGQNPEIRKALVIWSVRIPGDSVSETWEDKAVQQSWSEYYQSTLANRFCSVTGEEQKIRESHPAKLTYPGDRAKLISSNDKSGFTYLGRFEEANQAAVISAEVSHKAHAALRWLIERQGIRNDNQVTVVWATRCTNADEDKVLSLPYRSETDIYAALFAEDNINEAADFGFNAAQLMKQRLHGYRAKLTANDQISLLVLDGTSPGKGRAALTYYQEQLPDDYFANLNAWIDDFSWYQRYKLKEGKPWLFAAPSMERIADVILSKFELEDKTKKARKQLYARLLPVIAGGKSVQIPYDLMQQSFQTACNSNGCEYWEWERNIGVACALYKGWRVRHYDKSERRTYSMSLDTENCSRDYLYGRLLAQAESLEWYALYLQNGKKTPTRATNAERYFQQFAQRPYSTWRSLESEKLVPYKNYLTGLGKDFYKQAIGEIMELFQNEDFICDDKLSGEFLLGYHCQKMEIDRQIAERKAAKQKKTEAAE
ncbi:type I-C CRISPR-associated protein Cas8c/Csd1 [Neisseria weaveri]|uniref:type I-C CRISPR-associated protein Cas8c/Csd1 n=1 Tax=Neisseria weaveri TaxID=28091 RepID=UPI000D326287|nr:type I-C CRISPR-associated protein Cas8c/Csd1 [Neisseria weaveri]